MKSIAGLALKSVRNDKHRCWPSNRTPRKNNEVQPEASRPHSIVYERLQPRALRSGARGHASPKLHAPRQPFLLSYAPFEEHTCPPHQPGTREDTRSTPTAQTGADGEPGQ